MVEDLLDDDGLLDLPPGTAALRASTATIAPARPTAAVAPPIGLCALCGAKPARATCHACGRGACAADTWALLGVCKDCARGRA